MTTDWRRSSFMELFALVVTEVLVQVAQVFKRSLQHPIEMTVG